MGHGSGNGRRTSIDILDDDSLLNIFYHCRPLVLLKEGDVDGIGLWSGRWEGEYWWYKLAWVCRRWRRLILASPSYLGISLVCRSGTPVADMLAHPPPIPLIIDHIYLDDNISAEDEERTRLALRHHDRVRRIRLRMHDPPPVGLLTAIDGPFPILEYLYICPTTLSFQGPTCSLPSTLRAPHLRHLVLHNFAFPIGSPLLVGLVTLSLESVKCSTPSNIGPVELLQQLSLMPHLQTFRFSIYPALSKQDIERQLLQMPLSTLVTLPALRWFGLEGAYMKAVLPRITMPLLEVTEIIFTTIDLLNLACIRFTLQTMCKAENPRLCNVKIAFYNKHNVVMMYPHEWTDMPILCLRLPCFFPMYGLFITAQIFDSIGAVLTEVGSLTLEEKISSRYLVESNLLMSQKTALRWLLQPFNKVQTLHVSGDNLIKGLCLSLQPHDGESTVDLLPMLRVLSCPRGSRVGKSCRSFIAARRKAGQPVTICHP